MTLPQIKDYFEHHPQSGDLVIGDLSIIDLSKFVKGHISYLEANSGNATYLPYWERLLKVYNHLTTSQGHRG